MSTAGEEGEQEANAPVRRSESAESQRGVGEEGGDVLFQGALSEFLHPVRQTMGSLLMAFPQRGSHEVGCGALQPCGLLHQRVHVVPAVVSVPLVPSVLQCIESPNVAQI